MCILPPVRLKNVLLPPAYGCAAAFVFPLHTQWFRCPPAGSSSELQFSSTSGLWVLSSTNFSCWLCRFAICLSLPMKPFHGQPNWKVKWQLGYMVIKYVLIECLIIIYLFILYEIHYQQQQSQSSQQQYCCCQSENQWNCCIINMKQKTRHVFFFKKIRQAYM